MFDYLIAYLNWLFKGKTNQNTDNLPLSGEIDIQQVNGKKVTGTKDTIWLGKSRKNKGHNLHRKKSQEKSRKKKSHNVYIEKVVYIFSVS